MNHRPQGTRTYDHSIDRDNIDGRDDLVYGMQIKSKRLYASIMQSLVKHEMVVMNPVGSNGKTEISINPMMFSLQNKGGSVEYLNARDRIDMRDHVCKNAHKMLAQHVHTTVLMMERLRPAAIGFVIRNKSHIHQPNAIITFDNDIRKRMQTYGNSMFEFPEFIPNILFFAHQWCEEVGIKITELDDADGVKRLIEDAHTYHQITNDHHPEYWIHDDRMPLPAVFEMVCEWMAGHRIKHVIETMGFTVLFRDGIRPWVEANPLSDYHFNDNQLRFINHLVDVYDQMHKEERVVK